MNWVGWGRTKGTIRQEPVIRKEDDAMLVLSRKVGERILIGDDVWVTVVEVLGNRVRLGIDAPRSKQVLRSEIAGVPNPLVAQPVTDCPPKSVGTYHRLKRTAATIHN